MSKEYCNIKKSGENVHISYMYLHNNYHPVLILNITQTLMSL